ncbi:hypothetical protein C8250_001905 [Streptomyces sp. So13.3]|uniref:hypothetical protein n=1 Tax=Streptomyces TaxID=1883 RepID=UPI001105C14E|nr:MULTISPECIES: hypothetical protein [Streptomyces]MCZ4099373.1 hypothetical protein [Streptomyces sp. H39-C1]QNA70854.1 hypothetical protein C8250_001905 [Streptomyces sp. So13.3]
MLAYYLVASLGRSDAPTPPYVRWASLAVIACGLLLFLVGLLCGFDVLYAGSLGTPLFLGGGLVVLMYGRLLLVKISGGRYPVLREKAALAIVAALIVLSSFWTVNIYAQDHGKSDAAYLTDRLWLRPQVVLDTTERLYFQYPGVQETVLPEGTPQQHFRFRYRGLRLLAQSGDRMFIIPQSWTVDRGNVLIIPLDANVRVSFRPG